MDFRILCFIIFCLPAIVAHCTNEEPVNCTYTVYCLQSIGMDYYYVGNFEFRNEPFGRYGEKYYCKSLVTYGGKEYYIVKLNFQQDTISYTNSEVPEVYDDDQIFINIIYVLDLSYNQYHQTPSIASMYNLVKLNLSHNLLTTAVLSNINELRNLTEIDLSHNKICDILVKNSEYPYTKLKILDMSHNRLVKISDDIFNKFHYLQKVNLSYNNLVMLNQLLFNDVRDMTDLDISHNKITSINSTLLQLSQLIKLTLSSNNIENILPNEFEQLRKLETLDLSSNKIKNLTAGIFKNTIQLKTIDLSDNLLESIDDDNIFLNLFSLTSVNVAKNKLKCLPVSMFKNIVSSYMITENRINCTLVKGMFENLDIIKLNISHQLLTEVADYAFYNLTMLKVLLLNSNNIKVLSNNSFKMLLSLELLDLSDNQINNLNIETKDLRNLQSFSLQNNRLTELKHKQFQHLTNLKHLNLTGNLISHIGLNVFRSLRYLVNFDISNNSLVGSLETGTFDGLDLTPSLDISNSMLTSIQNASFNDMSGLRILNISRCVISALEFNAFINTGYIEILDLSYNKIQDFTINASSLDRLSTLLLNNNILKTISYTTFNNLYRLSIVNLSHNRLEQLHNDPVDDSDLQTINQTHIKLSNIPKENSFSTVSSRESILYLFTLFSLDLSHNNLSKFLIEDFSGLKGLHDLDLSFNKISRIQPGLFRSNTNLMSLNMSHNLIPSISYGFFRGLGNLVLLNVSYNKLKELHAETFDEAYSLTKLIVDYNQIESINTFQLASTSIKELSIGDNHLSCKILIQHKRAGLDLKITANKITDHSHENVDGVVCNKKRVVEPTPVTNIEGGNYNTSELSSNLSYFYKEEHDLFENISNILKQSNKKLSNLENYNNYSNILVEKIMKSFMNDHVQTNEGQIQTHYSDVCSCCSESVITEVCLALILLILVIIVAYYFCKFKVFFKNRFSYRINTNSENFENSPL